MEGKLITGEKLASVDDLRKALEGASGSVKLEGVYPGYEGVYPIVINLDSSN